MTNTNKIQHLIPIPASIGATQYPRARFRRTDADVIHVQDAHRMHTVPNWDLECLTNNPHSGAKCLV